MFRTSRNGGSPHARASRRVNRPSSSRPVFRKRGPRRRAVGILGYVVAFAAVGVALVQTVEDIADDRPASVELEPETRLPGTDEAGDTQDDHH